MKRIELQVDEHALERVQQLADAHHVTLEELIRSMIDLLAKPEVKEAPILGMFADEPELIDQVTEAALKDRGRSE
jgi:hypothetical protein